VLIVFFVPLRDIRPSLPTRGRTQSAELLPPYRIEA
jgi:hypothetical protein